MGENEEKIDYLEVDDPIPGQNYVCLSFVSPEAMIDSKESFKVAKFLQSVCKDKDMDFKKTMDQYKDFTYKFSDELQKDFDEQNDFKTNIRGLKIRGTYNTKEEAEKRAKKLQGIDSEFHVFVGQVGYWLPWDPCADKIEDETFINSQLNDMMEKYKENTINKDVFYEEQKREKVKAAREEAIRKKKEQVEEEAEQKKLDDKTEEKKEGLEETIQEPEEEVEVIKEVVGETGDCCSDGETGETGDCCTDGETGECCSDGPCEGCPKEDEVTGAEVSKVKEAEPEPEVKEAEPEPEGDKVDSDLKQSLEDVDPWMANKLKEKNA